MINNSQGFPLFVEGCARGHGGASASETGYAFVPERQSGVCVPTCSKSLLVHEHWEFRIICHNLIDQHFLLFAIASCNAFARECRLPKQICDFPFVCIVSTHFDKPLALCNEIVNFQSDMYDLMIKLDVLNIFMQFAIFSIAVVKYCTVLIFC